MVTLAVPVGVQEPRLCTFPPYLSSKGQIAVELAAHAGLDLDPWQQLILEHSLGVRADDKWSAFEVGIMASRQNGKDGFLEARSLAGLFEFDERLIIHSAHQFDTSLEAFMRLEDLIAGTPDLSSKVARVSRSHGEEGLRLKSGHRIRFRTRTKGGGRGFSADLLILNEAMVISEMAHGALLPTLSARPNPQVVYAGSAVDEETHEHGVVFARVRERGIAGDPALAYFDWSLDLTLEEAMEAEVAADPESWARTNPGLGIRISREHVANEQRSMDPRTFAVERLGVGAWPSTRHGESDITPAMWAACLDARSKAKDPVCFAFDVSPDRAHGAIAAAGWRSDGRIHGEVLPRQAGIDWLVPELVRLKAEHRSLAIVCDAIGPAGGLLPALAQQGIEVICVSAREHGQACGAFFDIVDQQAFRHLDDPALANAIKGAKRRSLGEAWAWSRKSSAINISPLVALTLSVWGLQTQEATSPFLSFA